MTTFGEKKKGNWEDRRGIENKGSEIE